MQELMEKLSRISQTLDSICNDNYIASIIESDIRGCARDIDVVITNLNEINMEATKKCK
jgi:hypothetical protein